MNENALPKNASPNKMRQIWFVLGILTALLGMGTTLYSVQHDIKFRSQGKTDSICNVNESLNCDAIAQNDLAVIMGIPLGFFGFAYFVAMALLLCIWIFDLNLSAAHLYAYTVMVLMGLIIALSLFLYSIFGIGVLCPSCMAIDSVLVLQMALLGIFRKAIPRGFTIVKLFQGGATATAIVVILLLYYWFLGPRL